jgi:redoxin
MTSESRGSRWPRYRTAAALLVAALVLPCLPSRGDTPSPTPPEQWKVGDVVQPFDAVGIDGEMKHVVYAKGSTTVLLFFLSGCPVCHRMIPEWNRAFERKTKGLQVIGVLLDKEPPGFFMATPISFPVVRAPGEDFTKRFKIQRVPMSLRVASGGRVEDVALGQIDPIRLGEVFRP